MKEEIIIKLRLNPEVAKWIKSHVSHRTGSNVTSKAVEFHYDYLFNKKGFLIRLVQSNYELLKHIVRIVGRING